MWSARAVGRYTGAHYFTLRPTMPTVTTNTDEWLRAVLAEVDDVLVPALDTAALNAAREGVRAAQQDHPYTDRTMDLTQTAKAERGRPGSGEAVMVWEMPYAGFVDEGTSRAKPYPFTPIARREAARVMPRYVAEAVTALARRLGE